MESVIFLGVTLEDIRLIHHWILTHFFLVFYPVFQNSGLLS